MLRIEIAVEDAAAGQTRWDAIEFSIPADFHAHNDTVAAALMTLVGTTYQAVSFNFPISARCAELLGRRYQGVAIGPVDPAQAPRRPGQRIGVNFSGGTDSVAVWLLLREFYGNDFLVITSDYFPIGGAEVRGFAGYHRDVTCRTNLRQRGFDQAGRFHFCVPLLFAEYLDLGRIVTGHTLSQTADGVADYRGGLRPAFLDGDLAVQAGGLEDVHLIRSLTSIGVGKLLLTLAPERIDAALEASSHPGQSKQYLNAEILRYLFRDAGLPLTPLLADDRPLRRPMGRFEHALRLLYLFSRAGRDVVCTICPDFCLLDLEVLGRLRFTFLTRYNPVLAGLLEEPLRGQAIDLFEACGVSAYDDVDWEELAVVRRQLKHRFARYRQLAD
ncbi:MAG: hypothetical protein DCC58_20345 [Chloroflexi bacterium]|nr:MAG: hypothetical protein DCC58_20345 [Chloroflexota bacterium]